MTGAGFDFTDRRVLVTGASHGIGGRSLRPSRGPEPG
jgi:hypothetical protein